MKGEIADELVSRKADEPKSLTPNTLLTLLHCYVIAVAFPQLHCAQSHALCNGRNSSTLVVSLVGLKRQLPQLRDNPLNDDKLTQLEVPMLRLIEWDQQCSSKPEFLLQLLARHWPHLSPPSPCHKPDQRYSSATFPPTTLLIRLTKSFPGKYIGAETLEHEIA